MSLNAEKKNVVWNMIGATFSAFNSLAFIIIVTRINGIEKAGIFSYAFATACIMYVVGAYIIRAFQVTDISGNYSDSDYIYNKIISCIFMMIAVICFLAVKQYDYYKSAIIILLCLFKCCEAFSEGLYGIIHKNFHLYKVGISLALKALLSLVVFLIIDYSTKNMIAGCAGIVLVNVLVIILFDFKNVAKLNPVKTPFSIEITKKLFVSGFFSFVLTFLGVYLINAPRYAIDDLLNESFQTIYGIIILPATFMNLLGQYIIQPALTKITGCISDKNYKNLKKVIVMILNIMIIMGICVFGIAYLLEVPVLEMLYGIELYSYKTEMMIIILGSILYGIQVIISYILIAFRRTGIQAAIFAVVAVIAGISSYSLVAKYKIFGASINYIFTMSLIAITFFICLYIFMRKYKKEWCIKLDDNRGSL